MLNKMFAIYDSKAEAYNTPFFFTTIGQATRAFSDEIANPRSQLHSHPEDFGLFELGTYDDATAKIESLSVPKLLGLASEFVVRGQDA